MTVLEAEQRLDRYFEFYNNVKFHQSLEYEAPFDVYSKGLVLLIKKELVSQANINYN